LAGFAVLQFALVSLIIGLVVLGFGGIAGASFAIAKLLFAVFLGLCLVFLFLGFGVARGLSGR
jgi:uncharacterized membrane protein YtjA (UPF0391 family)